MSMNDKVALLKELYHEIAGKGQDGDTMLAHINPQEALLLKAHGGSGTINPNTGLPEYKKAVKSVVKVVKKIAPVAIAAAGAYYGYGALTAGAGKAAVGTTAFWKGANTAGFSGLAATVGKGFTLSNAISGAGLLSNVAGNIQSQKYAGDQANYMRSAQESQNQANEVANRYRQLQAKRARIVAMRQGRIEQGRIEGGVGVLGQSGTSGFAGSVGSTGSQVSANLGNLSVASDVGNQISSLNTSSANFGTQANTAKGKSDMWSDVSTLGGTIFNKSGEISNLFGKIF